MARKTIPEDHIGLGRVAQFVLELLKTNSKGLTVHQLRDMLPEELGPQEHFDRRIREIRKQYELEKKQDGRDWRYTLGPRKQNPGTTTNVPERVRAAVLHAAHGRCQMCGATVKADGIKLQVDHKVPAAWGGTNERGNLWALCEKCNRGKRDHFSSLPSEEFSRLIKCESVHERIALFMKARMNQPVPDYLIETIANIKDQQTDWRKRLRELRYPVIGLKISMSRRRLIGGSVQVDYTLENWRELPDNPKQVIREFERLRKKD